MFSPIKRHQTNNIIFFLLWENTLPPVFPGKNWGQRHISERFLKPKYIYFSCGKLLHRWKRACGVNFCRTFILSISLFLELASSYVAQTLHNPPKVVWHWLHFSVRYACKCQIMAAFGIESFSCNHSINTILTGFNSIRQRIMIEIVSECH